MSKHPALDSEASGHPARGKLRVVGRGQPRQAWKDGLGLGLGQGQGGTWYLQKAAGGGRVAGAKWGVVSTQP